MPCRSLLPSRDPARLASRAVNALAYGLRSLQTAADAGREQASTRATVRPGAA